jgi:hypothetical protein
MSLFKEIVIGYGLEKFGRLQDKDMTCSICGGNDVVAWIKEPKPYDK